jgi:hypothetical protein
MSTKVTKSFAGSKVSIDESKLAKDVKSKKELAKIQEQAGIDDVVEDEIDIRPDKYITVINLCPGELNLSTLPGGRGKIFSFRSFGDKKRILYSNLVDVMEASPRFLEEGMFYIADKKVITKHGLDDIYSAILTKESIERMFSSDISEEDAATLYKSANKNQQDIIVNLFIRKLVGGTELNLNLVNVISRISKVDILAKVEESRFYSDLQKQPET